MESCTVIDEDIFIYTTDVIKFSTKDNKFQILPSNSTYSPKNRKNAAVTSLGNKYLIVHGLQNLL